MSTECFQAIVWSQNGLSLLDQKQLPVEESWIECKNLTDAIEAIRSMAVRGAPAIGITACYAAYLFYGEVESRDLKGDSKKDAFLSGMEQLGEARPTAVNLIWAVNKAKELAVKCPWQDLGDALLEFAKQTHQEDLENNARMGQLAVSIFKRESAPFSVLTHCNTGSLATGGYGTALGAVRAGFASGLIDHVFADETRPWLQGTRLTAWELAKDRIPFTLNVDSAAAYLLNKKNIKWVIVGADRVAANGDTANKIGTYMLAVLAKYHGAKFMVVAPTSTIDLDAVDGRDIEIEFRDSAEILGEYKEGFDAHIDAINPVFDVTPSELIDVIVTERGVIEQPSTERIKSLMVN